MNRSPFYSVGYVLELKIANYATAERIRQVADGLQAELAGVGPDQTWPLPDLISSINHEGKPTLPELPEAPGVYVDFEAIGQQVDQPATDWGFALKPEHRMSREDSHRCVIQGNMSYRDADGVMRSLDLAVKPGFEDQDEARQSFGELAMFQYMRSLGMLTLDGVFFQLGESGRNHMGTEFMQDVKTLDTVEWKKLEMDEAWAQLGVALETAADLHANLIAHGDLEFKNTAMNDIGRPVIVDPEFSVSFRELVELLEGAPAVLDEPQQVVAKALVACVSKDFTDINKSVTDIVLRPRNGGQAPHARALFKQQKRHIYLPYGQLLHEKLEEMNSPHTTTMMRVFRAMVSHKRYMATTHEIA